MKKLICLAFVLVFSSCLFAEVPNEIVYQGKLKSYGVPVDGTKTMNFEIYDHPDVGSGNLKWPSGNKPITVSSGIFTYTMSPTGIDWLGQDYYLQLTVEGKILDPREKITAQVYSLHSRTAEDISEDSGQDITFSVGGQMKATLQSDGEFRTLYDNTTWYMVPKGAIIMWSGAIVDIPSGWQLCDGTGGTPNLTDRFIVGAGNSYAVEEAAGSSNVNISHSHSFSGTTGGNSGTAGQGLSAGGFYGYAIGGHTHGYSGTTGGGGSTALDIRPPYFALAFIMRQ